MAYETRVTLALPDPSESVLAFPLNEDPSRLSLELCLCSRQRDMTSLNCIDGNSIRWYIYFRRPVKSSKSSAMLKELQRAASLNEL